MGTSDTSRQAAPGTVDVHVDALQRLGGRVLVQAWHKDGAEEWSYAQVGDRVTALARGLRRRIEPGEPVALFAEDRPEWILAALAILRAGAVVTPLDVQLDDDTLAFALDDSGARRVFTTAARAERIRQARGDAEVVLLDEPGEGGWQALSAHDGDLPAAHPETPAALFYTSGTTGRPKGVPLSHGNLAFQLEAVERARVVAGQQRVLLPLPLHHVYPFVVGMLAPLALGLTLVIPHALTGPQILRAVREGRAEVIIGVPRLYAALYGGIVAGAERAGRLAGAALHGGVGASRLTRRTLGLRAGKALLRPVHRQVGDQLQILASGGAALDRGLALDLEALGWKVATGYGLTETSPLLTIDPPGRGRPGSVGRVIPGVEVRIDSEAAPEERRAAGEGEILARGPGVFAGYHNRPDKTREVLTAEGWFRTGDLGRFDDDGYLYVTGRVSTLIVTPGGENIQPDELEARYEAHPAIREIGVLQREGTLVGLAVPSREVSGDEVIGPVKEALAEVGRDLPSYQRLGDVAVTRKPLPRTRLGKIRRHLLEAEYETAKRAGGEAVQQEPLAIEEMSADDRSLLEQPAARAAWEWLAERYPRQGLTPDTSPQLDLGVDSLEWLNFTMEIGQRTGVELDEEAIGRIETVRDLLQELIDAGGAREDDTANPLEDPESTLGPDQQRWLEPLGPRLRRVAHGVHGLDRLLIRSLFRLRVEGLENVPDEDPVVFACTHASYLDPFAVAAALPYERLQTVHWGGWTGVVFGNPVNRFGSRLAQVIPVDPRAGPRSSLALAAAVLGRGRSLIWFPEGQRSTDGTLQPFRPGLGLVLERFPVPVVLVSIRGTYDAMPPGRSLPRPRPVCVRFAAPLDPARLEREGEGKQPPERITDALHRHMVALHGEPAQRESA